MHGSDSALNVLLLTTSTWGIFAVSSPAYFGTYKTYLNICSPVTVRNASVLHEIAQNSLDMAGIPSTWLPINRKDLQAWWWMSGEYYGKVSQKASILPGRECGVIRAADKIIDEALCSKKYFKFLCEHQGEMCLQNEANCFQHGGMTYSIYQEKADWYEAVTKCFMKSQKLASLPKDHQDALLEKVRDRTKRYYDIWIGLRRADYFEHNTNISVSAFYWNLNDTCPCLSQQHCVMLEKTHGNTHVALWKSMPCSRKQLFICYTNSPANFSQDYVSASAESDDIMPDIIIKMSANATSWDNMPTDCQHLTNLSNTIIQQQIGYVLVTHDSPAWLPIKRVDLNGWYWTNGELLGNHISRRGVQEYGMDCAVLRAKEMIMEEEFCNKKYQYFICQGLGRCDQQANSCLKIMHWTYNLYNLTSTWYEAFEGCYKHQQSLAAFENDIIQEAITALSRYTSRLDNIWIGLRHREFQSVDKKTIETFKWDDQETFVLPGADCVVAHTKNGNQIWRLTYCNSSHQHLCLSDSSKSENDAAQTECLLQSLTGIICFSAFVTIYGAIVTAILSWMILTNDIRWKQCHLNKKHRTKPKKVSEATEESEMIHLEELAPRSPTTSDNETQTTGQLEELALRSPTTSDNGTQTTNSTRDANVMVDEEILSNAFRELQWYVTYFPYVATAVADAISLQADCVLRIYKFKRQPLLVLTKHGEITKFLLEIKIHPSINFILRSNEPAVEWKEAHWLNLKLKQKVVFRDREEASEAFQIIQELQRNLQRDWIYWDYY